MTTSISVIETDRQNLTRLEHIIGALSEFKWHGSAMTAPDALSLMNYCPSDIYLVDPAMPNIKPREFIQHAKQLYPSSAIVIVTSPDDHANIFTCMQAGACGYLLKESGPNEVVACLYSLRDASAWVSPHIAQMMLNYLRYNTWDLLPPTLGQLSTHLLYTAREIEILQAINNGDSFKKIAVSKLISPHTVIQHARNIYRKLEVHSRGAAVHKARTIGLIS